MPLALSDLLRLLLYYNLIFFTIPSMGAAATQASAN